MFLGDRDRRPPTATFDDCQTHDRTECQYGELAREDESAMRAVGDLGAVAAKDCIEHVLGVDVELLGERKQPGLPDLLYQQEGRTVIVEVKRIVDSNYMSLSKASSVRGYTRDARLNRLWTVALDWDGSIKRTAQSLVEFLMKLESAQLWHGFRDAIFNFDRGLYAVAKRYKISHVCSMEPTEKHPPGYYLKSAAWGGCAPVTSSLAEFAEDRLRSEKLAKLRTQLSRNLVTADERQAFLIVCLTDLMHMPLTSDADGELPEVVPSLPDPIDAVWLVSDRANARIVAWLPRQGWLETPAPWRPDNS